VAKVRVKWVRRPNDLKAILTSPLGGVYKDIFRRCIKVQNQAKRNLERAPRRVDTGTLRSDIHVQMLLVSGKPVGRVGFNVFYGIYVHDGTGIYGPKGVPIRPKTAKFLRWKTKKGTVVYALSVKGMQPNPFLKDAVKAAKG
jgi:hypothetical protein